MRKILLCATLCVFLGLGFAGVAAADKGYLSKAHALDDTAFLTDHGDEPLYDEPAGKDVLSEQDKSWVKESNAYKRASRHFIQ